MSASCVAVLAGLLAALPRCCACEAAVATVANEDRWWLCEPCWQRVPCGDLPPAHDMREPIRAAVEVSS